MVPEYAQPIHPPLFAAHPNPPPAPRAITVLLASGYRYRIAIPSRTRCHPGQRIPLDNDPKHLTTTTSTPTPTPGSS